MRPEILFPLFKSLRTLPGVGPKVEKLLEKAAGTRVVDLLWLAPTGLVDRKLAPSIAALAPGATGTLRVKVEIHYPPRAQRQPYRVLVSDKTGRLPLVFFHAKEEWLKRALPIGAERIVSGRIEEFNERIQMTHPDYILPLEDAASLPDIEPVYPLTEGLTAKVMLKTVRAALAEAPELPEWQDAAWLSKQGWAAWRDALHKLHAPVSHADLEPTAPARTRLAYDELLANQLALMLVRRNLRKPRGRVLKGDGRLRRKALAALPFTLTKSQERAIAEIDADIAAPNRMLRLLQGDVGSGKTVVAFMALLTAVEAGAQGAFMAPTEILVRQHFATLKPLAEAAGVRLACLTGREKGKPRDDALAALAAGGIDILAGTHALFSEDVAFKDLAIAVVDEQHRFGVHQRLALTAKGGAPVDMLVMTATPIPRTLALTAYGDMDVSRLTEKPAGRRPVATRAMPLARLDEVIEGIRRALARGARVFWVCPLIEESEKTDLQAAEARYGALAKTFANAVGLVHGRMKGPERDAVMARFKSGDIKILVATTVIEVGIDVPEATVMVIEHAERFGLAQLHQLRGRVGRSDRPSTCLLLYQAPLGDTAKARLKALRETDDGFVIAEEDLRLRGPGEILGTRQSGMPEFRLADLALHADLLAAARDDAQLVLSRDADLKSTRGKALRVLLYLFERDEAVRYLRSG